MNTLIFLLKNSLEISPFLTKKIKTGKPTAKSHRCRARLTLRLEQKRAKLTEIVSNFQQKVSEIGVQFQLETKLKCKSSSILKAITLNELMADFYRLSLLILLF